eukprot:TRINITY_DN13285_c0_g1_i1.p1 TRINITY_DN13285_c0_g1~~TRINITY_DN13285_c0_g1_i1.p1  ORF type:complete len:206 (+),score=21.14 TRINITY_DN13285_c0_g1_i1:218-835(+)
METKTSRTKIDFKVVTLGDSGVGKTSIIQKFIHDNFDVNQTMTLGSAFFMREMFVQGGSARIGIWDTAGHEKYTSMTRIYYRNAKAAIVCFDLTVESSFLRVQFWVTELLSNEKNCIIYIVGTKADLVRESPEKRAKSVLDIESFVSSISAQYFETSAKTGEKIVEVFEKITEDYLRTKKQQLPRQSQNETVDLTPDTPKESCSC